MRPTIPSDCNETISNLIQDCWHTDPNLRPSFRSISSILLNFMVSNHIVSELALNLSSYDKNETDYDIILPSSSSNSSSNTDSDSEFIALPRSRSRTVNDIPAVRRVASLQERV